ncbi:hypothetical protein SAMN02910417_00586 [Eubacterium oxidoreducens]|uniref:Uncharacterized protein n=1 Tax=Eubacterium oxidoreducens TaxID=1732 RepID=A0A1G6AHY2_EUBOX|nr:hypothetical protein SAMN02910417_00586 [Eubacterium oxidoreducens]
MDRRDEQPDFIANPYAFLYKNSPGHTIQSNHYKMAKKNKDKKLNKIIAKRC